MVMTIQSKSIFFFLIFVSLATVSFRIRMCEKKEKRAQEPAIERNGTETVLKYTDELRMRKNKTVSYFFLRLAIILRITFAWKWNVFTFVSIVAWFSFISISYLFCICMTERKFRGKGEDSKVQNKNVMFFWFQKSKMKSFTQKKMKITVNSTTIYNWMDCRLQQ